MESGRILIDIAACERWIWLTWTRRLCVCGTTLSEEGGGIVVPLVVLWRKDCIPTWDVAPFLRSSQGRYRVVRAPFSLYGDMSEISRDLFNLYVFDNICLHTKFRITSRSVIPVVLFEHKVIILYVYSSHNTESTKYAPKLPFSLYLISSSNLVLIEVIVIR